VLLNQVHRTPRKNSRDRGVDWRTHSSAYCWCRMRTASGRPCLRSVQKGQSRTPGQEAESSMGKCRAACWDRRCSPSVTVQPSAAGFREGRSSRERRATSVAARCCKTARRDRDLVRSGYRGNRCRRSSRVRRHIPVLNSHANTRTTEFHDKGRGGEKGTGQLAELLNMILKRRRRVEGG